jgi:hypothetical protein
MSEETTVATAAPAEKVKLTITGVLQDLQNGLDRKQIAKKYGLNKANATKLFQHEKLLNRKVIRPLVEQFELVDDAPDLKPIVIKKKEVKPEGEAAASTNGTATASAPAATAPIPEPATDDVKGEW